MSEYGPHVPYYRADEMILDFFILLCSIQWSIGVGIWEMPFPHFFPCVVFFHLQ